MERVQEFLDDGNGGCIYRTWQTMGGCLARAVRKMAGEDLKRMFGAWGAELGAWCEEIERQERLGQKRAEEGL